MKNKLISLLGLVSKKEYEALFASNEEGNQLCKDLKKELWKAKLELNRTVELSKFIRQKNTRLKSEVEGLKDEINALNNLRASDQQSIKELSKRKKTVYYTCKGLEREFNNQRDLAKHLKITQSQVNYMLNGKRQNKYNIKRHER